MHILNLIVTLIVYVAPVQLQSSINKPRMFKRLLNPSISGLLLVALVQQHSSVPLAWWWDGQASTQYTSAEVTWLVHTFVEGEEYTHIYTPQKVVIYTEQQWELHS